MKKLVLILAAFSALALAGCGEPNDANQKMPAGAPTPGAPQGAGGSSAAAPGGAPEVQPTAAPTGG